MAFFDSNCSTQTHRLYNNGNSQSRDFGISVLERGHHMDAAIMKELQKITPEEQLYLDKKMTLASDDIYFPRSSNKIESHRFLEDEKLLTVRPHTRFVDFEPHSHNYIEMMYVCKGSVTHTIGDTEIVLRKGDFLVMNQHVEHGIKAAGYDDVAINFIARQEFFDIPHRMVGTGNAISEFLLGILRTKDSVAHYLHFQLNEDRYIENLVEGIIASIVYESDVDEVINQYMMGIVFLHLLRHVDGLTGNSSMDYHELLVQSVLRYIDTRYQTAQLARFADETHQNVSVLSRLIRQKTGTTFQELLKRKRLQKAVQLLVESDLSIEEISANVGYEDPGHFFREFKKKYGTTPRKFRLAQKNNESIPI